MHRRDEARAAPTLRVPAVLEPLRHRRVDVVGVASVEGSEMARYLAKAGFTQVVGHDQQPSLAALERSHDRAHAGLRAPERQSRFSELLPALSELRLGPRYLEDIEGSELAIPTQAWFLSPANRPLKEAVRSGLGLYSMAQAYLDLARGPVLGVTGTHGKSTTSALAAAMLRRSGHFEQVWLGGNDRHSRQALAAVAGDDGRSCLVLELSNRQLVQLRTAPAYAVLTNITPNHLDEHGGLEGYVAAKRRIFELPGCQVLVRNGDDRLSLEGAPPPPSVGELRFARGEAELGRLDGGFLDGGELVLRHRGARLPLMLRDQIPLVGGHNVANVLAAATAALAVTGDQAGIPKIAEAVGRFMPLPHRLQLVWQADGVSFYDDLSSTTPQSTVAAIRALNRSCVLICGGDDKGISFEGLVQLMPDPVRRVVLLPGSGSERLLAAVEAVGHGHTVSRSAQLESAVLRARELAVAGDAVLLSPACPGFFSAYYRQGGFRSAVREATSPRPRRGPG